MARWDPGAEDRLRRAAMDLYRERGFEHVSVAEITERAGLTRRTFFRYFADKREVLFASSELLPAALTEAVHDADPALDPLDVALRALRTLGVRVVERVEPEQSARRRAVIAASPELQERERTKLAACTAALRSALHERGVADDTAQLVAHIGVAVFGAALARWSDGRGEITRCFDHAVEELAGHLGTLTATRTRTGPVGA